MSKTVFTHKPSSRYDDLPEERYHFPAAYLRQVEHAVGDFIIYYEPGRTGVDERNRTGRQAYVATAQVIDIRPDNASPGHFYAVIDPSTYLDFDRAVPFREDDHYYEQQLRRSDGGTSKGAFGRAVRLLSEQEYDDIIRAAFTRDLGSGTATERTQVERVLQPHLLEEPSEFYRPTIERVLSRPVRDAAFARAVQSAYGAACAMSGLRIINGGGRAEVQAAHIRPVADKGPDSIRNGVALSGTIHWMFDRGLISIGPPPRYDILVASIGLSDSALRLLRPERRLSLPADRRTWPAASYLEYHRVNIFKS